MTLSELRVKISITGAEVVKRNVEGIRDAMNNAAKAAGHLATAGKAVGNSLLHIGKAATTAALSFAGINAALFGLASVAGFTAAKNLDSLTRGLASVSVNAEDLRGQLGRLKEVAKLPGLGFAEAVQGSLALQAAGVSAETAERSLAAFGNALATVGKGKAELDGVTLALSQIASKGKVSAEEINQINERVPQIRAAMNAAFGTSDTEALGKMGIDAQTFISGVVTELEKLPKVAGGVGNAIENLQDRLQQALLPLGKGLIAMFEGAAPSIERLFGKIEGRLTAIGEVFAAVGKSGVLAETLEKILGLAGDFNKGEFQEGFAKVISGILTAVGNVPAVIKEVQGYVTELFGVMGRNANRIGLYIGGQFEVIFTKIASSIELATGIVTDSINSMMKLAGNALQVIAPIASTILKALAPSLGGVFDTIGGAIGNLLKNTAVDSVIPGMQGMKALQKVWNSTQLEFPTLEGLPDASGVFKAFGAGGDENLKRIMASMTGLSDIPDGLNYGGKQSGTGGGQKSAVEASLQNIEWNTKATADALSLRRQTTGGGELGNIGVTPSELLGGSPGRMGGYGYGASTGDLYAQAVDLLRRAAEQTSQRQLARASGSGMAFKPR